MDTFKGIGLEPQKKEEFLFVQGASLFVSVDSLFVSAASLENKNSTFYKKDEVFAKKYCFQKETKVVYFLIIFLVISVLPLITRII